MPLADRFRFLWRTLFDRHHASHEFDRETQFHVDMEAQSLEQQGHSPEDARRLAHVSFGGRQRFREEAREAAHARIVDDLLSDVAHAARTFRRAPAFTLTVIATLAIGIGATTVIFSVTDNVVLRALPYANADRMVSIQVVSDRLKNVTPTWPPNAAHFLAWNNACSVCDAMAAIRPTDVTLTGVGDPTVIRGLRISESLFRILGTRAQLGRLIGPGDDTPGNHIVVIGDALWRQQFGARRDIIGTLITLDNVPWTIVGVTEPSFRMIGGRAFGTFVNLPPHADLFVPLGLLPYQRTTPGEHDYGVIALLKPGVTSAGLTAQLNAITQANAERLHDNPPAALVVKPLQASVVGAAGRPLILLLAAVAAVLLIMCVNLANLFLARSTVRRRESAVRAALGAARGRLVRQALTETVVLGLVGGLVGVVLAVWGVRALVAAAPADLPRLDAVRIDARVLIASLIVSMLAGLTFGLGPAIHSGRIDPGDALKEGARGASDGRRSTRARTALIASQVGLSALLLVVAGLFLKSFGRVMNADRGFTNDRILAVTVSPPAASYRSTDQRNAFLEDAMHELSSIPGVTGVGATNGVPLEGETWIETIYRLDQTNARDKDFETNFRFISPSYFNLLGVPLVAGRGFSTSDRGAHRVVLSANAARTLWPGENAVGKYISLGNQDTALHEVIGIAANVRTTGIEHEGSLTTYLPYWETGYAPTLLIRTAMDPVAATNLTRATLRRVAPSVPITTIRTMQDVIARVVAQRRFEVVLIGLFALTALLTASIGIYGIIAHSLSRRTNELSVRIALGAEPRDVQALVFREMLRPVATGLILGVGGAVVVGRAISGLLYEVQPSDGATLVLVALILTIVAAIACWIPSRRATRLDPVDALRAG
ncbi:MAG TPA: ABC transporter permease [Gemmatimonadaceae bacterium]